MAKKPTFKPNQIPPGIQFKNQKGANQPPRNNKVVTTLINKILPYSPKKNKAKPIAEYSTL